MIRCGIEIWFQDCSQIKFRKHDPRRQGKCSASLRKIIEYQEAKDAEGWRDKHKNPTGFNMIQCRPCSRESSLMFLVYHVYRNFFFGFYYHGFLHPSPWFSIRKKMGQSSGFFWGKTSCQCAMGFFIHLKPSRSGGARARAGSRESSFGCRQGDLELQLQQLRELRELGPWDSLC